MKIGIISGSRIPRFIINPELINIDTAFGTVTVKSSVLGNHTIYFIHRHGIRKNLPPHKVNYQANIQAFAACHADCIISLGTVGSLKSKIQPGDVVIPHDFIDITKLRPTTYFDDKRIHIDMTHPFCPALRCLLVSIGGKQKLTLHDKGVYLVTEGPRLETPAEISLYQSVADVVGMTLIPEAVLARERGICYASICLVCNMAAGLQKALSAREIREIFSEKEAVITSTIENTIKQINTLNQCQCGKTLDMASL